MKINKLIAFSVVVSPVAGFSLKADVNGSLANWNVITTGNAYLNDTVAGRIFVGGNLAYGNQVASGEGSVANTNITLAVAGNINSWANIQHGSAVAGGTSQYIALNGGTLTTGSPIPSSISPVSSLVANSLYWSTLTPNSTVSYAPGSATFNTAAGSSVAVFDVTGAQTFNANLYSGIGLNLASGVNTVIVNVNATTINGGYVPFLSSFQNAFGTGNVVFNFYNATSIDITAQVYGYIVAPNATVNLHSGVEGGIMANSINNIGGVGVALPAGSTGSSWSGSLPDSLTPGPVPEPASLALLPVGAAALWFFRRRPARD